jgi:hypothetical protein
MTTNCKGVSTVSDAADDRALALSMELPGTSEPTRVDDDDEIRR